jgi:hypothetical protein
MPLLSVIGDAKNAKMMTVNLSAMPRLYFRTVDVETDGTPNPAQLLLCLYRGSITRK